MLRRIISSALMGLLSFSALCQTWSLEDCVHYAMENSTEVKKQSYSIEREKLTLQEGKWASSSVQSIPGIAARPFQVT